MKTSRWVTTNAGICVITKDEVLSSWLLAHESQAGQWDAQLSGDVDLRNGGVPQAEEVGHFQLGVGERYGLVEQLDGPFQVTPLHLCKYETMIQCCAAAIFIQIFPSRIQGWRGKNLSKFNPN